VHIHLPYQLTASQLYILSVLPLKHHSIGASLLQTTTRIGVALGMAVTTAVWSSYTTTVGYDVNVAYSKTFVTTAAFASLSLAVAPFIHIGRQGHSGRKTSSEEANDHRPSRRWSIVETLSNNSTRTSTRQEDPARSPSLPSEATGFEKATEAPQETSNQDSTAKKIIWVVCEACNRSRRVTDPVGDPARYFNDVGCGQPEKPNHDMIVNGSRRRFPLVANHQYMNV
jgi:hypothetical protein